MLDHDDKTGVRVASEVYVVWQRGDQQITKMYVCQTYSMWRDGAYVRALD